MYPVNREQKSSKALLITAYAFCQLGKFSLGEFEKGRDRCFIVACRDFQVAYAQAQGEHGVFSGALLQGLNPTLQSNKWVTNYTLVDFVKEALKEAPQHPICKNSGGQIILTGTQSIISNVCPYKGLAYFDFNDEDPKYFYGRETLTKQLVEKVHQNNFLVILGESGSGKSSVVRAGLLYQLKLGKILPGSDRWKIYEPFTPSEHPLESLERLINVKANQLQDLIKTSVADRVVLVVDQFEEAFTLCLDETERQQFFECLLNAVEHCGDKFCLVLVMRTNLQSNDREIEYGGLDIILSSLITNPAKQVGLEIDREAVNEIVKDALNLPSNLPIIQYTLVEMWKKSKLKRITIYDYIQIGKLSKYSEFARILDKKDLEDYFFISEISETNKTIFIMLNRKAEVDFFKKMLVHIFVKIHFDKDKILLQLKSLIDNVLFNDNKIQKYLSWLNQKSNEIDIPYKKTAIRAFYSVITELTSKNMNRTIATTIEPEMDKDIEYAREIAEKMKKYDLDKNSNVLWSQDSSSYIQSQVSCASARDIVIDRNLCIALSRRGITAYIAQALSLIVLETEMDFRNELIQLKEEIFYTQFSQDLRHGSVVYLNSCIESLRKLIIKYRNVGHDWQFTQKQNTDIQRYYEANKILFDILQLDCLISDSLKNKLEDELFLPIAEIQRREQE